MKNVFWKARNKMWALRIIIRGGYKYIEPEIIKGLLCTEF